MHSNRFGIRVECRNAEEDFDPCGRDREHQSVPRRFFFGRRQVVTVDVIDRWLAADHRYFKLKGDDDATYILRHDLPTNRWELTLYDSANLR